MKLTAQLENRYVPEFNGNRDLPKDEQITVEIKRPNQAQMGNLKSVQMSQDQKFSFTFNIERILTQHIGEITNLESDVNGNIEPVHNGRDLATCKNPKLTPLVTELCTVVAKDDTLKGDEEKN